MDCGGNGGVRRRHGHGAMASQARPAQNKPGHLSRSAIWTNGSHVTHDRRQMSAPATHAEPPVCAAGRWLLRIALALLSWLICAMESWLCVPAAEHQEGDADQNRGEQDEDAGVDG